MTEKLRSSLFRVMSSASRGILLPEAGGINFVRPVIGLSCFAHLWLP
jgi:hypothetical protein